MEQKCCKCCVKPGWILRFNDDGVKVYCTPCSEELIRNQPQPTNEKPTLASGALRSTVRDGFRVMRERGE
jgi:hypothetical protein